uniref:DUF4346 domain-containing protein n=1 Tax=Wildemania schizophylla TaxID=1134705 RepID=A0A126G1K7_WILSC|nr:hypothetical protein [Wildemania schizophylla]AKS28359.1 hypothetical protein [Wildemania schizophylla]
MRNSKISLTVPILLDQNSKQYLIDTANFNYVNHHIQLDTACYFIITSNKANNSINVEQYCSNSKGKTYAIFFTEKTAALLCNTIFRVNQLNITISAEHASYIGRELLKSEIAILLNQKYIQN